MWALMGKHELDSQGTEINKHLLPLPEGNHSDRRLCTGGKETPCWLQLRNKVICYFPDLCEDIFVLHHQRVGVHVSREQVLSVAFCASLGSALDILRPWREAKGNQSEVNYSHLPSWWTLHSPELHFRVHKLNLLSIQPSLSQYCRPSMKSNISESFCKVRRAFV